MEMGNKDMLEVEKYQHLDTVLLLYQRLTKWVLSLYGMLLSLL